MSRITVFKNEISITNQLNEEDEKCVIHKRQKQGADSLDDMFLSELFYGLIYSGELLDVMCHYISLELKAGWITVRLHVMSPKTSSSLIRPSFVNAFIIKHLTAYRMNDHFESEMATDDIMIRVSVIL